MRDALMVGGETRVGQPFVMAEHARQLGEVAIVGGADRDVAVGASKGLVRRGHADAPSQAGRAPGRTRNNR